MSLWLAFVLGSAISAGAEPLQSLADGLLRYGGDAEGGAPYTFYDAKAPDELVGFEVDIAGEIARRLGVRPQFRQNAWESLIPALLRGDSDAVINGIEVTPDHAAQVAFSRPYYIFQQVLTVRAAEERIRGLAELKGRRVGTLLGSLARRMLEAAGGAEIVTYQGVLEPYEDLASGRIDAVLLDGPIAAYYAAPNKLLKAAGEPVGEGLYAVAVRKDDAALLGRVDSALGEMIEDGTLRKILLRWGLWNGAQARLQEGRALTERFAAESSRDSLGNASAPADIPDVQAVSSGGEAGRPLSRPRNWAAYLPQLFAGAGVTIAISVASMGLAMVLGLALALGRLYGGTAARKLAVAYVEIVRGTPLLIQLFLLYYGLPNLGVKLPALVAAVLGLGLNYAASECEIYRAGLQSLPRGQTEAALSLGLTQAQALRFVLLPQALRTVLPPVTNDFIAMLKDSSLVSVITVVELTKAYSIHAASTFSYLELGLLTAALYLAMSLPLARLSRRLETKVQFAH